MLIWVFTVEKNYENIQLFSDIGTDLSKSVSLQTDYKYVV